MKDLVEYIVKNIVSKPEGVFLEEAQDEQGINLRLSVNPEDMGLVIGKAGQTIKAIRKLLIARAMLDNVRVNLELVEPEDQKTSLPAGQTGDTDIIDTLSNSQTPSPSDPTNSS